jgi:uncharacterized repeat protein (TIGR03803 family)
VLHSFGGTGDGIFPVDGLIADSSGNLYGTTPTGGLPGCGLSGGCGVVFKLSPSGTETVLYSFKGGSDGAFPQGPLIADSSGNLYGTGTSGNGLVFKLSPGGTETVLHSFTSGDGLLPRHGLIADSSGNLYGTTSEGGGSVCSGSGCGIVFKLTGTGFVPPITFSAFTAMLTIQFGGTPNQDAFGFGSNFTLSSTAPAINPVTQPVTLQVGTSTITIPIGSFVKQKDGSFAFKGVIIGSASLEALIKQTGTLRYAFQAKATGANLTGTTNPVPVTLTIGNNSGTASVTATIVPALATAH